MYISQKIYKVLMGSLIHAEVGSEMLPNSIACPFNRKRDGVAHVSGLLVLLVKAYSPI